MGKKHKHPEHENLERWLVSYADFITLLFATFVVLYALSQADLAKFQELSVSLRQAFNPAKSIMENPGGVLKGTPDAQVLPDSGNSLLDKISPKAAESAQREGSVNELANVIEKINTEIQKINVKQGFSGDEPIRQTELKLQERGIVISFASSLFFEPGSAGLKPQAFSVLDKVAEELKNEGRIIHVEGHTDNAPISTAIYPSNWELSAARSSSVIRYFIQKHKFPANTLAAVGYAHTRPLASNANEEGRQKNRRVDLVILFSNAVEKADAGAAQKNETILIRSNESEGAGHPDKDLTKPTPTPVASTVSVQPIQVRPDKPRIKPQVRRTAKPKATTSTKNKSDLDDPKTKVDIGKVIKDLESH